jgi:hypothetical protein
MTVELRHLRTLAIRHAAHGFTVTPHLSDCIDFAATENQSSVERPASNGARAISVVQFGDAIEGLRCAHFRR